ncbi:glycosyltransferase [Arthrobacter sp. H35-D1]|uniref:glycosyltransferase n=1 Tax=Arthrobacter sp. H35-D1 TaxID=3046202 RepID=UPI0024B96813|nr:glycosyltransferase [Arthrobacter sp. H35-D1]MDJ0315431.1 glycosyltransferase [Arthrobacter sp. H35-D1]
MKEPADVVDAAMKPQVLQEFNPLSIAVLAHLHHPIASPFAGGMESHTAHLVSGLVARGHEVTLFAKDGSVVDCQLVPVLDSGFVVRGYPEEERTNEQHEVLDGAMERAVRFIQEGSFDAVVNNSLSPVPHRVLVQLPTLHVFHTPPLPRLVEILKEASRAPDLLHRYVTVSEANARPWQEWIPDIEIVHNGIDSARWKEPVIAEHAVAAWTGRIAAEKGTHVAIAAARAASLKLRFAGPIHDQEYFRTLIEPQLDDDISYLGHLDQQKLQHMIASSQVFISSPLWEEPFGLTTLEAMACGTPVAALPAGAMTELIGATGGVVADGQDSEALAMAASKAKNMDRTLVQERASGFTLAKMIKGYERILHSMVHHPFSLVSEES